MDFNQTQPKVMIALRGGQRLELSVEEAREVLAQLTQVFTAPSLYPVPHWGTPVEPQGPYKWYVGDPVTPSPGSTICMNGHAGTSDPYAHSCLL